MRGGLRGGGATPAHRDHRRPHEQPPGGAPPSRREAGAITWGGSGARRCSSFATTRPRPGARAASRDALADAARGWPGPVTSFGRAERVRLVERLRANGVPADVAAFALLDPSKRATPPARRATASRSPPSVSSSFASTTTPFAGRPHAASRRRCRPSRRPLARRDVDLRGAGRRRSTRPRRPPPTCSPPTAARPPGGVCRATRGGRARRVDVGERRAGSRNGSRPAGGSR